MTKTVFITGATGNIGGKLVTQILRDDPKTRMVLLVRGASAAEARQRVEKVLKLLAPGVDLGLARNRIKIVRGDITCENLGLPETDLNNLARQVTHIIHSAAATKFNLPLRRVREINCTGTKNVLAFAARVQKRGNLKRMAYVSTAYVCGDNGGKIFENNVADRPRFSNTYEQSKWEAERLVRSQMSMLPLVIFRPSIVVGDSHTGRTTAFNVLYTPLKYICFGALTTLPCSPGTPLDVVPVDYVSAAIRHIIFNTEQCVGQTYNIVAGKEKAPTVAEVVNGAVDYFNLTLAQESLAHIRFIPTFISRLAAPLLPAKVQRMLKIVSIYRPYICVHRTFDDTNTQDALRGTSITVPRLSEYMHSMLGYSLDTGWGKRLRLAA